MAKKIKVKLELSKLEANALAQFLDQLSWHAISGSCDGEKWQNALARALNRLQMKLVGEEIDMSDKDL